MDKEDVEYYSTIKKKERIPFAATWINLEILILSEVRQKMNIIYHLHMKSKRLIEINLFIKQSRLTDIENKLMVTKREQENAEQGEGWINEEFGISKYRLLYI